MLTALWVIIIILTSLLVLVTKKHNQMVFENERMRMTLVQDYGRVEFNHSGEDGRMPYIVHPNART